MEAETKLSNELVQTISGTGLVLWKTIVKTLGIPIDEDSFYQCMTTWGYLNVDLTVSNKYLNSGLLMWGTQYPYGIKDAPIDEQLYISVQLIPELLTDLKKIPTIF